MIRRVRRGHVIVLLVLFGLSLTPLTCVEPVHAGGGSPPPPSNTPFPVLYVHSDHLGSTTLLTCYKQGTSCADGNPLQYFRYDGYGMPKLLFPRPFHIVHTGDAKTDRLYTSQRWDALTGVYDYGARHYDPRIARFLSHDPVREYMNPYAYVRWNPVMYVDPDGSNPLVALALVPAAGVFAGIASSSTGGSFLSGFILGSSATAAALGFGLIAPSFAGAVAVGGLSAGAGGALGTALSIHNAGAYLATPSAVGAIGLSFVVAGAIGATATALGAANAAAIGAGATGLLAEGYAVVYAGLLDLFAAGAMGAIANYGIYGFPSPLGGAVVQSLAGAGSLYVGGAEGVSGFGSYVGFFWPGGGPGPGPGLGGGGGGFGPGPSGAAPSPPGPSAPPAGCQGTCTVFESPGPPQGPPPPAQEPEGPGGPSPGPIFTYPLI
jgi:RHS repeat-associated protein